MPTKKRTILSVAYPLTEVGPDSVGGSEQILTMLDRALTDAGHQSIVIAAEGSRVGGTLIPSPQTTASLSDAVREWGRGVHEQLIRSALAKYKVDLVHMHSLDFHCYMPPEQVKVLATLHLPPDWYPEAIFRMQRPQFKMNCVSFSQFQHCPESPHLVAPISNGVDLDKLKVRASRKQNFALCLGRICPEKGFHFALDAARQAEMPLLLAGQVFPYQSHIDYFNNLILPRLDDSRRFVGPASFARKKLLLAQAKCLIIPSTVAETSSLVAMEALACGTPVIAFRSGALPEIVRHGLTGFIVDSVEEMSAALRQVDSLDLRHCRREATNRFSAETMTAKYLDLYDTLIEGEAKEWVPHAASSATAATGHWLTAT